ncbi:MAG: anaerobic ribonucleoside-triphosphate reductase activating protein [Patescibacteria group bacterium]
MTIGGLQKLSLLDYPGKPAAVIFTVGCNFCCGFCHNPELVMKNESRIRNQEYSEEYVLDFLKSRRGLLEGVVITGGEPTIQPGIVDFVKKIKEFNFLVKLDTNGFIPIIIERLVKNNLVDFLAMDIKAPMEKYAEVTGRAIDFDLIKKSIEVIKNSGVDYEFRSTVVSGLHSSEDILDMAWSVRGAKKFVLQQFVSRDNLVDESFVGRQPFNKKELEDLARQCERWVGKCEIR